MKIVADASAVLAVLMAEPDAADYLSRLAASTGVLMSPVNWWEVQVRMHGAYGDAGIATASEFLSDVGAVVEPITARHAEIAMRAFTRFRGRPARLNMGDCFAYALAKAKNAPLLYKGADFSHTDVESA